MTQSIEEIILSDPHMIEIVPGEEWDFPEIDYSKLKPQSVENAKRIVETIIKTSISFPYLVDNFANHFERNIWETELQDLYRLVRRDFQ